MSKPALRHLRRDPTMARLIKKVGPPILEPKRVPTFQSIAQAIIHQQLSGKVAGVILGRFQALFGKTSSYFPEPAEVLELTIEQLRSAGLSGAKANAILDLARRSQGGLVPTLQQCDSLTDSQLVEVFTAIKGVGPWMVEMLLIFNLGRPDVLPMHDLGIRRGFQIAHGLRKMPTPERVARDGRKWAPHRTLAAWYLWRAVDDANENGVKKEKKKKLTRKK